MQLTLKLLEHIQAKASNELVKIHQPLPLLQRELMLKQE
jgi:hypothetical protein